MSTFQQYVNRSQDSPEKENNTSMKSKEPGIQTLLTHFILLD